MILYYAMGGGLGHITRSLAIIKSSPLLKEHVRLLVSSRIYPLLQNPVQGENDIKIDHVGDEILLSRKSYYGFLENYIETNNISEIIIDTFFYGIVGEFADVAITIPKILIARYLKYDKYTKIFNKKGAFPDNTLLIEKQSKDYYDFLKCNSNIKVIDRPIILERRERAKEPPTTKSIAVVHSGDEQERKILHDQAVKKAEFIDINPAKINFYYPEKKIFPVINQLKGHTLIISGGGYNSCALASTKSEWQEFSLIPFDRRYDDQHLRVRRIEQGLWQGKENGNQQAAEWILEQAQTL